MKTIARTLSVVVIIAITQSCQKSEIAPNFKKSRSIFAVDANGALVSNTNPNGPRKLRRLVDGCCPDGGYCCIEMRGTCLPDVIITPKPKPKFFSNLSSELRSGTYVKDFFPNADTLIGFSDCLNSDSSNVRELLVSGNYAIQVSENAEATEFLHVYPKDLWDGFNKVAEKDFAFTIPVK